MKSEKKNSFIYQIDVLSLSKFQAKFCCCCAAASLQSVWRKSIGQISGLKSFTSSWAMAKLGVV